MPQSLHSSQPSALSRLQQLLPVPAGPPLGLMQFPPDFAARDVVHQRTIRLANYRGKQPVVLALMGRHRLPLRRQLAESFMVTMNETYPDFRQAGIEVLLISWMTVQPLKTLAADLGLRLPLLSDETSQIYQRYRTGHIFGAPLSAQFVLDVQGRLRYYHLHSALHPYATAEQLLTIAQGINPR